MISIRQHAHRKSIRDIVMFAAFTFSSFSAPHSFTISSSTSVHHIPQNLVLKNVVLFTRHGDRAQISRGIGPNFPENEQITKIWKSKLPSTDITSKLKAVATYHSKEPDLSHPTHIIPQNELYAGWDHVNSPYGMLTDIGSQQLQDIGLVLRKRYNNLLSKSTNFSDSIYTRSTNMCRTIMSLRSLLSGLISGDDFETLNPERVPKIVKRLRTTETLYPQADGVCPALSERRKELIDSDFYIKSVDNYELFENKIKAIFGYEDKVNWLEVKEVLTCLLVHDIKLPKGITEEDIDKATEITGFVWGALYNDDVLNRLAIGRFLTELLDDISHIGDATLDDRAENRHVGSRKEVAENAKILIYSGHDSTLVPLLCALGIYNNHWPPYASYLALEIAEDIPVSDSSTSSSATTTPSKSGTSNATNDLWVRAVYNDLPIRIGSVRPISISNTPVCLLASSNDKCDINGINTNNKKGVDANDVWYPYSDFIARIQSLTISQQEYSQTCQAAAIAVETQAASSLSDEIQASIGTVKTEQK